MPGGERAEHEVLHRRFGGDGRIAVQRDQRVERQRQQLQAEVQREEVVGRDHHHHAEQREQHQHEELAAEQAARARGRRANRPASPTPRRRCSSLSTSRQQVVDEHVVEAYGRRLADRPRSVQPAQRPASVTSVSAVASSAAAPRRRNRSTTQDRARPSPAAKISGAAGSEFRLSNVIVVRIGCAQQLALRDVAQAGR